jgi:hypothetical protein
MIEIPDFGEGFHAMWQELLYLAENPPAPWTLIGAHMVALHGHRFVNGQVRFDILGPDGIGSRTGLFTSYGARTVEVPGGTQALQRAEMVAIRAGTISGMVPVPNLLGAILVKVRAIAVDEQPEAQRGDVAFLLSLVDDPDPLDVEISSSERRWLRRHPEFSDSGCPSYREIPHAADAATVFRRLSRMG